MGLQIGPWEDRKRIPVVLRFAGVLFSGEIFWCHRSEESE